ncbi:MAG: Cys-tRNA(Pro) deacylase [Acidimicrobiales bacterium]
MAGKGTPATAAAARAKVAHTLHEYAHDPANRSFGAEAVDALGLDPDRTFKTLIAVPAGGGRAVCAVVPVSAQLDLKALAAAAGAKQMAMAEPAVAERATGYLVGGISPLGQKQRLALFVDSSAEAYDTVFVSAGRRGLEIELAPADLLALTGGRFAPIARRS